MTLTYGKDRFYENLMRQIPRFKKRTGGEYHTKFKYRFRDLDCRYCTEYKSCPPDGRCPYILDNLADLSHDKEFTGAVLAAETCDTPQKRTLLYLQTHPLYL